MNTKRFAFALERISPNEWALFEKFASQFLVPDYPGLRTAATASGDLGARCAPSASVGLILAMR